MDTKDKSLENFKNATASTLRTIAADNDIGVIFSAGESAFRTDIISKEISIKLPLPSKSMDQSSIDLVRGTADAKALRIKHHNQSLHRKNAPMDLTAQAAFDALEQARCESIGARKLKGVAKNLNATLDARCQKIASGQAHREDYNLGDALYVMARLALTQEQAPESADNIVRTWQPWIDEKLGDEGLQTLLPHIHDQDEFATAARKLIKKMDMEIGDDHTDNTEPDDSETDEENIEPDNNDDNHDDDQSMDAEQDDDDSLGEMNDEEDQDSQFGEQDEQPLDENTGDEFGDSAMPTDLRRPNFGIGDKPTYNIYTNQFDEIVTAEELADHYELERLRNLLDNQLSHVQGIITKLANRLQRRLMAKQRRAWQFDLEEGMLDTSRLARIVANPTIPLAYKQEKQTEFRDTIVTLLIDNSGSMRGRPIAIAAMCADIITRTLERCDVKVEILGFTTRAWKGGKSRDMWIANGRPEKPGRLNDLRHIIYKAADTPWRRTKKNLGLMLKEGLLKENIDGEALAWAHNRLSVRPEDRKILMVISDGAPVDDSTLSVNSSNILEQDLRNVIYKIENVSNVELTAIGIGHDVTRYYNKAMTISDVDELAKALTMQLEKLFDEDHIGQA